MEGRNMNWWYAIDDKDNELWILVDRWFNARAFALSKLGEKVEVTADAGIPPSTAFRSGQVFEGIWSKHDATPGSTISFKQLDMAYYTALIKRMEEEAEKKRKAEEKEKRGQKKK
jgi:hypothetical protein